MDSIDFKKSNVNVISPGIVSHDDASDNNNNSVIFSCAFGRFEEWQSFLSSLVSIENLP